MLTLVAAGIGTVLVTYRFFADGYDNDALAEQDNSVSRGIGLYLALAGALIVLGGCVLAYRNSRDLEPDDEVDEPADDTPPAIDRPPRRSSPPLP